MGLARTAGRPAGSHCACLWSTLGVTAPETKKNILVYLCSRPAQGGGAGLVRYYHQNKTAPEPPLPYFGGSTSKKTAPEPPLPILLEMVWTCAKAR